MLEAAEGAGAPKGRMGTEGMSSLPPRLRLLRSSSAPESLLGILPRAGAGEVKVSLVGSAALLPK